MAPTNRWKEVVQSLFAIGLLLGVFWLCRPGLFARGNSNEGGKGLFGLAGISDGESYLDDDSRDESDGSEWDGDYEEILAMPTCDDLRRSIETLRDARNRLLDVAVNQDAQAMLAATAKYREAIQKVQAGFATLKMRVAPEDFPDASQQLLAVSATEDGPSVVPCELGSFEEDIYQ